MRSYRDGDEHYDGQVGSEPTPQAFLEALWACTDEWWRVLKPTGSLWVNLGDKYAGSGGHNNAAISRWHTAPLEGNKNAGPDSSLAKRADNVDKFRATRRNAPDRYNQQSGGARPKSLMGLPWRYALGCIDRGWILRRDLIWSKPNGLPESVTDRCRSSHEYWFHLTKQGSYFSAMDEIREAHTGHSGNDAKASRSSNGGNNHRALARDESLFNPLGKLPGSVWTIPSEPLVISDEIAKHYDLPNHFAAFPQEWPRRLILGWSPGGVCTACGEGRRPVAVSTKTTSRPGYNVRDQRMPERHASGNQGREGRAGDYERVVTGYACACSVTPSCDNEVPSDPGREPRVQEVPGSSCRQAVHGSGSAGSTPGTSVLPPTRPAVVLDPFGGTGTTAGVARTLGRIGISVDLSNDYCRLARWRIFRSGHFSKTETRTHRDRTLAFDFGEPA